MSDIFNPAPMAAALDELSQVGQPPEPTPAIPASPSAPKERNTELEGKGWVEKTRYDYEVYNASSREEREALEATADRPGWASTAEKYEWSGEFGDIGPEHPELEKQLFKDEFLVRTGNEFESVQSVRVVQEGPVRIAPVRSFADAGLHPIMLQNVKLCNYDVCTPIQAYCIPAILQGHDVFASAHTGSGKTAAYLIPILSRLMGKAKTLAAPRPNPATFDPAVNAVRAEPLVVIVSPTRELATQIFDEARRFCYRSMLRPSVVYGGAPFHEQRLDLQKGCDVLIGTPGRLCDFMDRTHLLSLRRVKFTVIDEADEMLEGDWEQELKKVMHGGDNNPDDDHSYMMFSATFPKMAREMARQFLAEDHVRVGVGRPGSTHANVEQQIVCVAESEKNRALYDLLLSLPAARTIVFVNSRRTADLVDDYLFNLDLPSTSIHGDRTQREREDALRAFRKGRAPILVATGISARGLDIRDVMHVINYDLPSTNHGGMQEYIHRIGRTARIGNIGLATSFYNPERNEEIAELLVKTLLETKQEIPDFLQSYIPEGYDASVTKLEFEDESDPEDGRERYGPGSAIVKAVPAATETTAPTETWGAGETTTTDVWGNGDTAAADVKPTTDDWGRTDTTAADATPAPDHPGRTDPTPADVKPTTDTWGSTHPTAAATTPATDTWGSTHPTAAATKPATDTWGSTHPTAAATKPATDHWGSGTTTAVDAKPTTDHWGTKTDDVAVTKPAASAPTMGTTTPPPTGVTTPTPTAPPPHARLPTTLPPHLQPPRAKTPTTVPPHAPTPTTPVDAPTATAATTSSYVPPHARAPTAAPLHAPPPTALPPHARMPTSVPPPAPMATSSTPARVPSPPPPRNQWVKAGQPVSTVGAAPREPTPTPPSPPAAIDW